jgi:agmatinase
MSELNYLSLPNRDWDEADVLVQPIPHELTVSYKSGTRNGPEAILVATDQLEYYEEDGGWSPFKHMGVSVLAPVDKRLYEANADFHSRLTEYARELPSDALLLSLGGEHSVTASLVAGRLADQAGTVVNVDAHADLRPYFEGSEFSHAGPMHRIREAGHRIVMVGVRSLLDQEADRVASDDGISCYMDRALHQGTAWRELLDELAGLSGPVYLSVDLDALEPGQAPGVGTPQPGGLSWYQLLAIVETVMANRRVVMAGCDIVEMVPEASCVTDMIAAKLSQKMISAWGRKHGYHQRAADGSQTEIEYE